MHYKSLQHRIFIGLLFSVVTSVFAVTTPATTPNNMTCEEFLALNSQSYTPVVFWILNDDTQYKHGDYVDLTEFDTLVTPELIKVCKKNPETKLSDLKKKIETFAKKHL